VVTRVRTSIVLVALILCAAPARAQDELGVRLLMNRIEHVVRAGDAAAYFALMSEGADRNRAREFASSRSAIGWRWRVRSRATAFA